MMVNAINSSRKSLLPGRATYVLLAVVIAMASKPAFSQAVFSSPVSFASYAIDANGNLYVWGEDNYLQPIASTMTAQDFVPVKVAFPGGVTSWVSAAAGLYHSRALSNNGDVYAWGLNNAGQ